MAVNSSFEKAISQIRSDFEKSLVDSNLLACLYQEYTQIKEVDIFLKKASSIFPKLNCGITAVYLRYKFPELKVLRGTFRGTSHTFCVGLDGCIVDITADQNGGPKIYIGELQRPWILE